MLKILLQRDTWDDVWGEVSPPGKGSGLCFFPEIFQDFCAKMVLVHFWHYFQ